MHISSAMHKLKSISWSLWACVDRKDTWKWTFCGPAVEHNYNWMVGYQTRCCCSKNAWAGFCWVAPWLHSSCLVPTSCGFSGLRELSRVWPLNQHENCCLLACVSLLGCLKWMPWAGKCHIKTKTGIKLWLGVNDLELTAGLAKLFLKFGLRNQHLIGK